MPNPLEFTALQRRCAHGATLCRWHGLQRLHTHRGEVRSALQH